MADRVRTMSRDFEPDLKNLGLVRKIPAGAYIFRAGEKAEGFFRLLSGEIRAFTMDEQGREIEIVRLRPGDFLGEAVAFAQGSFPLYARAVKESRVLYFDRKKMLAGLDRNPGAAAYFIRLLAGKCLLLNERIEALGLRTVCQRLIQYLLTRCSGNEACLVDLDVSKAELARLLGTIPETLSRNFRQLEEEGLIEVRGKKIRIRDCPRMKDALAGRP